MLTVLTITCIVASVLAGATNVYAYNEIVNTATVQYNGNQDRRIDAWICYTPTFTNWGPDYITLDEQGTGTYNTTGYWSNTFTQKMRYYEESNLTTEVTGNNRIPIYFRGFLRQRYKVTITTQTSNVNFEKFKINFRPYENIVQSYTLVSNISTSNNTTTFNIDVYTFYYNYALHQNNIDVQQNLSNWDIELQCTGVNSDSMITMSIETVITPGQVNRHTDLWYYDNYILDEPLISNIFTGIDNSVDIDTIIQLLNYMSGDASNIKTTTDAILTYCQNYLPNIYSELQIIANTNDSILDNVVAILNLMIQSEQEASSIAEDIQSQAADDETKMSELAEDMTIPTVNPDEEATVGQVEIVNALTDSNDLISTVRGFLSFESISLMLVIVFSLATLSYIMFGGQ